VDGGPFITVAFDDVDSGKSFPAVPTARRGRCFLGRGENVSAGCAMGFDHFSVNPDFGIVHGVRLELALTV
jgi:hypothetical protein